jgi:predicted 3-demethylubiquinone-9 3-methyltransferase (glyoxalase superfamily)
MMTISLQPCLWYSENAEEAAAFYVSVIPNSRVERITGLPVDNPSGPADSVKIVEFVLAGAPMMAFTGGPHDPFNHAISMVLLCDTQDEVDRLWNGLLEGGHSEACGWLRDRYGVSWQITPRRLGELMSGPDRERAKRVAIAMMNMIKLDIAVLEAA